MHPHLLPLYPLYLKEWGSLFYLHTYCIIAKANRTFRLD
jgi:hypothetical protein